MLPMKGSDHVSSDLQERMALFVEGQLSWPVAGGFRRCVSCKFFTGSAKKKGRCALVKEHGKKPGVPFNGVKAFQCAKFEERP